MNKTSITALCIGDFATWVCTFFLLCRTNKNIVSFCYSTTIQHIRYVETPKRQVYNCYGERSKPLLATGLFIVRFIFPYKFIVQFSKCFR